MDYTYCKASSGKGCDKFFENVTNTGKTCVCKVKFNLSQEFKGDVFMYYGLSNFYQVCYISHVNGNYIYSAIDSTRITRYFQPIKTFRTSKQKICSQGIFRPITEEAE